MGPKYIESKGKTQYPVVDARGTAQKAMSPPSRVDATPGEKTHGVRGTKAYPVVVAGARGRYGKPRSRPAQSPVYKREYQSATGPADELAGPNFAPGLMRADYEMPPLRDPYWDRSVDDERERGGRGYPELGR